MGNITPNPLNFTAGAGILKWDLWAGSHAAKTGGFWDMGDCSAFDSTPSTDMKTKRSGRSAGRPVVASVLGSSDIVHSVTCSEFAARNIGGALLGDRRDLVISAPGSVTAGTLVGDPTLKKGQSGRTGVRGNLTGLSVKSGTTSPGAVSLVDGTDYTYDPETGEIAILATSPSFVDGQHLYVSYTAGEAVAATAGRSAITLLTKPLQYATIWYKSAADQITGLRSEIYIPKVQISPDGPVNWLSEDFSDLKLKFQGIADYTCKDPMGNSAPFGWQLDF